MWWPGYKGPQLYKKGTFRYGERVHSSAQVHGRVLNFPADDPALAIVHFAYESIRQYLTKINLCTRLEAEHARGWCVALMAGNAGALRG